MYVIIAPIQIKDGHKDEFIEAMLDDARGSVENEPGCLRFDVVHTTEQLPLHRDPETKAGDVATPKSPSHSVHGPGNQEGKGEP